MLINASDQQHLDLEFLHALNLNPKLCISVNIYVRLRVAHHQTRFTDQNLHYIYMVQVLDIHKYNYKPKNEPATKTIHMNSATEFHTA
jgi:hypothetical protein